MAPVHSRNLVNRRNFLTACAASLFTVRLASAAKLTKQNLGFQIYTVRTIFAADPAKLMKDIRAIGYTEVEATADKLTKDWAAVEQSGLQPVSAHLTTVPTDAQFADAKSKGFTYAVVPYIAPPDRGGVPVMKKLAQSLQDSGKRAKDHGLQLCYHNHAFEFEPMDGTTPLKILMDETDPSLVQLELDIFWAAVAGHNPVEVLSAYSGRVPLMHVKDKASGIVSSAQYNEKVPKETFKEAGNGTIDIPAVLKAADSAGVKHYFVEQDHSPDPLASLRQSYQYLSKQF